MRRACILGSLRTRVFETRTATGSELFSLLTCLHTTTFTLLSIFSPLEMISTKIWETLLSWYAKFSLPVAVRVSKTRVLKLPIHSYYTLVPEVFLEPRESREAAKKSREALRKRKTSGYLGLQSHFYADVNCQTRQKGLKAT